MIENRMAVEEHCGVFQKKRPLSRFALCIIHAHTRRKELSTLYANKQKEGVKILL